MTTDNPFAAPRDDDDHAVPVARRRELDELVASYRLITAGWLMQAGAAALFASLVVVSRVGEWMIERTNAWGWDPAVRRAGTTVLLADLAIFLFGMLLASLAAWRLVRGLAGLAAAAGCLIPLFGWLVAGRLYSAGAERLVYHGLAPGWFGPVGPRRTSADAEGAL